MTSLVHIVCSDFKNAYQRVKKKKPFVFVCVFLFFFFVGFHALVGWLNTTTAPTSFIYLFIFFSLSNVSLNVTILGEKKKKNK